MTPTYTGSKHQSPFSVYFCFEAMCFLIEASPEKQQQAALLRSHPLLLSPAEGTRGLTDKLATATPEELKRLWSSFQELDADHSGLLGIDEVYFSHRVFASFQLFSRP